MRRRKQQARSLNEDPQTPQSLWPDVYLNHETGRPYKPHHESELEFVTDNVSRYWLVKGGEGGGKSVAGIQKDLDRLRAGMSGILVSPDLPHFKKSVWPEFRRWCPRYAVVARERYRLEGAWEPQGSFALHFQAENGLISTLYCGGIDDPTGWEGPNVSFAHFDEARRHPDAKALKTLDGRVRIPGPNGERPQLWLTTTPRKHWLFDYFGPPLENPEDDEFLEFKKRSRVVTLLTIDNELAGNLSEGYTEDRGTSLTESEKRVLLAAEWEDIDEIDRFLTSIIWWDSLKEELAPLERDEPLVCAADAGVVKDSFGFIALSKHPSDGEKFVVRHAQEWKPNGRALDFDAIEKEITEFCQAHNVLEIAYDPYQLHQMMSGLRHKGIVHTREFKQQTERSIADNNLLDLIVKRKMAHDGRFAQLRSHLDNADKKVDQDRKLRIVKRSERLKIDLAVCLSMAAKRMKREISIY